MKNLMDKFLTETDQSGRFIVISKTTGIKYFVEPVGNVKTRWGDVDPATKKVTGKYGQKYRGSIDESESIITDENGFKNIVTLKPGESPLTYIDKIDSERQ